MSIIGSCVFHWPIVFDRKMGAIKCPRLIHSTDFRIRMRKITIFAVQTIFQRRVGHT